MDVVIGIVLLLLGAGWMVTSLMCIAGVEREWARAKPSVFNYLARNFMPYTYLGFGMVCVGLAPHLILDDPPLIFAAVTVLLVFPAIPIGLLSGIHWPLFLSPPWYRRWYKRGGRMGNNVPLWEYGRRG